MFWIWLFLFQIIITEIYYFFQRLKKIYYFLSKWSINSGQILKNSVFLKQTNEFFYLHSTKKLLLLIKRYQKLIQFLSKEAPTKVPKLRETISCARIHARQIHYAKKH